MARTKMGQAATYGSTEPNFYELTVEPIHAVRIKLLDEFSKMKRVRILLKNFLTGK